MHEPNISTMVSQLEENLNQSLKRIQSLESTAYTRNKKLKEINLKLQLEKFKNNLLCNLLETHTTIKPQDIFKESENGLHLYNFENGNIPVFLHNYSSQEDLPQPATFITTKKKGKSFRTINTVEIVDEKPQEQEEKLKIVQEKIEVIVQENSFDVPYKETKLAIETIFLEISKTRIIKKLLISLKDTRNKLLGRLKLPEYITLVQTHIQRLQHIFSLKKSIDHKKNIDYITSSLSPLEQRLVFFGQYFNSPLDSDDIQRFQAALQVHMSHPKRYIPFLFSDIYNKIYNYTVAVSSMSNILNNAIVNPTSFNNIVYLPMEKSTQEDPYSFYTLESINPAGKRFWKLECRLDEFSKSLSQNIKTYCIDLFRKIYFDTFHDNLYRPNYPDTCPCTSEDCAQLLQNIIFVSRQKSLCNSLRELIVENCTIKPTELDKFNLTSDDKSIKRSFTLENDDPQEIELSIKRLFDNIDKNNIEHIITLNSS
jgi:hypothetical protein